MNKNLLKSALDIRVPKMSTESEKENALEVLRGHYNDGNLTIEEGQYYTDIMFPIEYDEDGAIVFQKDFLTSENLIELEILKAKTECEEAIYAGFDSDCLGEVKHFDCEAHDQTNIIGLTVATNAGMPVTYKAHGELECYEFTAEQVALLATDMLAHIKLHTDEFNAKRKAILGVE